MASITLKGLTKTFHAGDDTSRPSTWMVPASGTM